MPVPLQASRKVYQIVPVYVVPIRWLLQQGPGSLKGTSATVSLKHSEIDKTYNRTKSEQHAAEGHRGKFAN